MAGLIFIFGFVVGMIFGGGRIMYNIYKGGIGYVKKLMKFSEIAFKD